MAKIKHIAYTTTDPDKVAAFFMETLDMEEVGRGSAGHVYLSDGDLKAEVKLSGPDGIILDVSETGWLGN